MRTQPPLPLRAPRGVLRTARLHARAAGERGIVLIIALIMLVVISLLATMSVRNATSSEGVSANVRLSQLANQSAEIALRQCEDAVAALVGGNTSTLTITASQLVSYSTTASWKSVANWDTTPTVAIVLPASTVNASGVTVTFSRPPECMIERLTPATYTATYSVNFVITARGFGPEVPAAGSTRTRPSGSEVWMQSTIELQ